jgi:NAD(P)-dependent dehydrogenase (short-subunit alcohol dehydrogenase family)
LAQVSVVAESGVAVIMGAAGGIGAACCKAFSRGGFRVLAADIREEAVAEAIEGLPNNPVACSVDVTNRDSVAASARSANMMGAVSALVYAPGLVMTSTIEETDWVRYRALMGVNLDGAFHAASAYAPLLKAAKGTLVLVSSIAGRRGEAGASHYCASKFGLIGLSESLAAEFAPSGARVNAICPGNVDTPMLDAVAREIAAVRGVPIDDVHTSFRTSGSAIRLVQAEEVAALCLALCAPGLSAVTGATITVDAGGERRMRGEANRAVRFAIVISIQKYDYPEFRRAAPILQGSTYGRRRICCA